MSTTNASINGNNNNDHMQRNENILALLKDLHRLSAEAASSKGDGSASLLEAMNNLAQGAAAAAAATQKSGSPACTCCISEKNHVPDSFDEFIARLTTFDALKWDCALSPVECALSGWVCTGKNTISCVTCDTTASGVDADATGSHLVGCPWKAHPCSKTSFLAREGEALQEDFLGNLEAFFGNCDCDKERYCLSPRAKELCLHNSALKRIFDECLEGGYEDKADLVLFGVVFALFGWNFKKDDANGCLRASCDFCKQHISAKHFSVKMEVEEENERENEEEIEGGDEDHCEEGEERSVGKHSDIEEDHDNNDRECDENDDNSNEEEEEEEEEEITEPANKLLKLTDMLKDKPSNSETPSETEDEDILMANRSSNSNSEFGSETEDEEDVVVVEEESGEEMEEEDEEQYDDECEEEEGDDEEVKSFFGLKYAGEDDEIEEYSEEEEEEDSEDEESMSEVFSYRGISSFRPAQKPFSSQGSQAAPICLSSSDEEEEEEEKEEEVKEEEKKEVEINDLSSDKDESENNDSEVSANEDKDEEEIVEIEIDSKSSDSLPQSEDEHKDESIDNEDGKPEPIHIDDSHDGEHEKHESENESEIKDKEEEHEEEKDNEEDKEGGEDHEDHEEKKDEEEVNEDHEDHEDNENENEENEEHEEQEQEQEPEKEKEKEKELSKFEKAVERLCSGTCIGLDPEYDHRFFCMWTRHKDLGVRSWHRTLCANILRKIAHNENELVDRIITIIDSK